LADRRAAANPTLGRANHEVFIDTTVTILVFPIAYGIIGVGRSRRALLNDLSGNTLPLPNTLAIA